MLLDLKNPTATVGPGTALAPHFAARALVGLILDSGGPGSARLTQTKPQHQLPHHTASGGQMGTQRRLGSTS